MRLIDADEILTGIEELKTCPWATEPYMFHHELAVKEALEIVRDLCVNQAPTVDAVPVVRCKDCYFYQDDFSCGWNGSTGWAPDDYCSYFWKPKEDAKIGGAGL